MSYFFLFVVATLGGALNSVAGGGSFITLPALMSAGVGAVVANATSTLAMWPGSASSSVAYRREIMKMRRWLFPLSLASLVGGLAGGWLLIKTSDARFLRILPWMMLLAALIFTFGGRLTSGLRRQSRETGTLEPPSVPAWAIVFQLLVASYGGYFGGGMGIMMLAALSLAGMTDIHEMNGLKTLLAVFINGVALIEFVVAGTIAWRPGLVMVAGGIAGGYAGAAFARRLPAWGIRTMVIAIAWAMTVYFFAR